MFSKQETLDRLRINFTEAYKECLDVILGADAWEKIKIRKNLSECQMQKEIEDCREYYIKEFSEAELFMFSLKSNETIREFFVDVLFESQNLDLNEILFKDSANNLLI